MKKLVRRLLSAVLAGVLMAGMCLTASAFSWPQAYWGLQGEWTKIKDSANPDLDQIISVTQQTYDVLTPLGLCSEVCNALQYMEIKASWACEIKGDVAGALTWAERQYAHTKWLTDNGIHDYSNNLLRLGETRMDFLRAAQNVVVYAQTDNSTSPYRVGPRTGTWFGSAAQGSKSQSTDTSATLVYLDFSDKANSLSYWIGYWKDQFNNFSKALNGGVIELAWNIQPENTAGVQAFLNSDSYINETLRTIGTEMKDATVLLRVGAEMNNWGDSDPEVFKQAFRKVASSARPYSNIQMVFSPNDICNLNHTTDQYYPGDEYVDWVGMSTYHSTNFMTTYTGAEGKYDINYDKYFDDSFYGNGVYDHDPLVTIKPIVDLAKAHNKPVMISECGFSYINKTTGQDQTAFANDQLTWFYSYINMLYPQVKAVFYFDVPYMGGANDYYLASSSLNSTYDAVIRDNGAYLYQTNGTATGWQTLDKASLSGQTVRLAAYASLPGRHSTTVRYYVDGNLAHTTTKVPFYYDMPLTPGTHTVKVEAEGGQFKTSSQTYTIQVDSGSTTPATPTQPAFTDVAAGAYYAKPVAWAVEKGITNGTSDTAFSPDAACTQVQILTFLWRAAGKPDSAAQLPFTLNTGLEYADGALRWAMEKGMIDSSFDQKALCTRSSAVKYIWQACGSQDAAASSFTDVSASADYAKAVAWAVEKGVTNGTSDTTFSPFATCTRGQIVTFLSRAYNK